MQVAGSANTILVCTTVAPAQPPSGRSGAVMMAATISDMADVDWFVQSEIPTHAASRVEQTTVVKKKGGGSGISYNKGYVAADSKL